MKKFFALVVSLILILSLTACGGSDSSTDSAPGYDWCSLKLVFECYQGDWYLVGLVHSEWTV